jgi:hypothetical protein
VVLVNDLRFAGRIGGAPVVMPRHPLVGEERGRAAAADAERLGVAVVRESVLTGGTAWKAISNAPGSIILKNASAVCISWVVARLSRSARLRASVSKSGCASRTGPRRGEHRNIIAGN